MTYTQASNRATNKYKANNKQKIAEKQVGYGLKYRDNNREEYNARCLHNFYVRKEFSKYRNILIDVV